MELAYVAVSVAGMLVAVSLSIRQEKKRDRELSQCLLELSCLSNQGVLPDKEDHKLS